MLKGIDVSNWQRSVDWRAHAERGVAFAFAKATEGEEYVDKWFERNWEAMREHWLVRGAYHFARPGKDPEEQARHFLRTVIRASSGPSGPGHGLRHGDLLALDLETDDKRSPREVARFARRWCEEVVERTGVRPFIYTHYAFAHEGNCDGLGRFPLWIAAPGRSKGDPMIPGPWDSWTIHQYANNPVDKNIFDGTRAQLTRHGKRRRRPHRDRDHDRSRNRDHDRDRDRDRDRPRERDRGEDRDRRDRDRRDRDRRDRDRRDRDRDRDR